ncbi:hypothetical protein BDBG_17993 [Blastomyces gilchristii SLH14081]|uniref:Uncharacterized protein n=1 Tax=Blastomyces gilchristii (strain SLH14081) TaxID=559298 RepID=A0A179V4L6_BLAGS|nr:uncharacterized protein BDBG_17993 [Blastomyces gilchristii SLH14081]OAT14311.1 hypothetical protein BDBG_17993 [Blastomyces gilchristii SLH14081]
MPQELAEGCGKRVAKDCRRGIRRLTICVPCLLQFSGAEVQQQGQDEELWARGVELMNNFISDTGCFKHWDGRTPSHRKRGGPAFSEPLAYHTKTATVTAYHIPPASVSLGQVGSPDQPHFLSPSLNSQKISDNPQVTKWLESYLGIGEWVMDQSVAVLGSSGLMVRSFLAYTYMCIWAWFGGMISLSRATTQMWLYIPMQTCGEEGPEVETGDTRGRALRHEQRLKVDRPTDRPTDQHLLTFASLEHYAGGEKATIAVGCRLLGNE